MILSLATAQRLWPNQSAVGRSIRLTPQRGRPGSERVLRFGWLQVIGVARNAAAGYSSEASALVAYLPTATTSPGNIFMARVLGDPESARRPIDADLTALEPGGVEEIHKVEKFVAGRTYPFRAAYWVSAAIGVLALLLTVSRVYGVLSYFVVQRTREIGIRMALGATVGAVIASILKQSFRMIVAGLTIGTLLALGASRLAASSLVMMNAFDTIAYASAVAVVLTACVLPARRAARVEPLIALRAE